MTVYADVLFFVNFMFCCLALALLAKCLTVRICVPRLLAAAAVGAAGAVIVFCIDAPAFAAALLKLALSAVMIICAFGFHKRRTAVYFLIFTLFMAILSGAVIFIISAFSGNVNSVIKNGIVYFDMSGRAFFFSLIAAYPASFFLLSLLKEKRKRGFYEITVTKNGKSVSFTALYDSGNLLKEPLTGKPVIVAEWEAVKELFPYADFEEIAKAPYEHGFWTVPYRAMGGNGTLAAFSADGARVRDKELGRVFIGISGAPLSPTEEYRALIGAGII